MPERSDRAVQSTSASFSAAPRSASRCPREPRAEDGAALRQRVVERGSLRSGRFVLLPGRNARKNLNRAVCRIVYLSIVIFQLTSSYVEIVPVIWLGEHSSPWDDLKDISPKWVSYLGDVSAALTVFIPRGFIFLLEIF